LPYIFFIIVVDGKKEFKKIEIKKKCFMKREREREREIKK